MPRKSKTQVAKGSSTAARYKQKQREKAAKRQPGRPRARDQHPELLDFFLMDQWYTREELSLKEIGAKLGVSHNTVRTALISLRITLRGQGSSTAERKPYERRRRLQIPEGFRCECGEHQWYQPMNSDNITCNECGRKFALVLQDDVVIPEPLVTKHHKEWRKQDPTGPSKDELAQLSPADLKEAAMRDPTLRRGERPSWHTKIRGAGAQ